MQPSPSISPAAYADVIRFIDFLPATQQAAHVFEHDEPGANVSYCADDFVEEVGAGAVDHALALARVRQVLTRESARDDVDTRDAGPVDLRYVAEVRHVRPVVREDLRRGRVELGAP
jgi:hypothetical protein